MKKFSIWSITAIFLMIGCPWLAVAFAGTNGMAICFILFFAINPAFSAICGIFSGMYIKKMWALPLITAVLFLAGVWTFFDFAEPAFLLYAAAYLVIGIISMSITAFVKRLKHKR